MERQMRDLEAVVAAQKEQLQRYEKRLKDVVTAYKGLLKEKEALETSLSAITTGKEETAKSGDPLKKTLTDATDGASAKQSDQVEAKSNDEDPNHLQTQIITLMNSLATLSAEKSRMEASFQSDKKQLRAQLAKKDQVIADVQTKLKDVEECAKADVDEIKAKWIVERQEREKETNNQMLMIRELQKLYADERHLKENIEMQLNNFKMQFANSEADDSRLHELQSQLRDAKSQLKQMQTSQSSAGDKIIDSSAILKQVQQEMHLLKEQHAIAIKSEQRRVLLAEEQSRKQAALHEDRVANLEARLAELSNTVGQYDRLRQQDQVSIQVLKRKLLDLERNGDIAADHEIGNEYLSRRKSIPSHDMAGIVDEVMRLKKMLVNENEHAAHPIDLSKIFVVGADHTSCQEELRIMQAQCEAGKIQLTELQEKCHVQKSHIHTLQEKVKVLNRNIDEQEMELKQQAEKVRQVAKDERTKWREAIAELENENRFKINELEQQLQKQRQRSLQLLEEKEQEIKTLQTSFEIFHSVSSPMTPSNADVDANDALSDVERNDFTESARNLGKFKSKNMSVGENCHMLHYANEIARKDIEITGLRKAKYAAETSLRKAIQEKVTAQEDLCDKIAVLEEQVDRLERCKTREGANLEYLKNVIISFITTREFDGKKHMLNAISAVLQFTPSEMQTINNAFQKK